ncbi:hypothetical protein H9L14_06455 [Sphingomonas sediminicola]|uniref:Uracil-DNA glycosylase-like domain-containing protein n=1 Tax=Sphingomonas sediminicola TaxID=386874 RepID=A0ABX6TBG7_9SPHN|nr:uracil-DNA glycosylase family protein [Sphingomonas sediminicola]QNP46709.1 hypothetical protein H9L14_06455 [Sphingomonas sediminicola]
MGGEHDRLTAAEAASVIGWWIEAGVDVAIQEQPRAWLGATAAVTSVETHTLGAPEPTPELPASLEAFRHWLGETPSLPLAKANARRALPIGIEAAEVMLLADMPTPEDVAEGQPIAGPAWELTQRMLAAIGFDSNQAYVSGLTCFHSPGTRLSGNDLEACATLARRHVALAKPKRLLLLGMHHAGHCSESRSQSPAVMFTKLKGACGSNLPSAVPARSTVEQGAGVA